jgi:thiol-disulfide isomerase/thioredoxin
MNGFYQMGRRCVVMVAVVGLFAIPSWAGSWKDSDLAKSSFGPSWTGPDVTPAKLRGKVVLAETWGYRCPPCVASMSKMVALQKKYGKRGLVVVAMHAQGTSDSVRKTVLALCKTKKVNYIVTAGGHIPGRTGRGIPHVQLIAPNGKVVWQGSPSNPKLAEAIPVLLRKVKLPAEVKRQILASEICGDRKYVAQKKAVKQIYAGQLGASYKLLLPQKDAEGAAGEEATHLLEGLDTYAKSVLAEASALQEEHPAAMIKKLRAVGKLFVGTPYGEQANAQVKELTQNKTFQAHLKCERIYQTIMKSTKRIGTPPENEKKRSRFLQKKQSRIKMFASQAKSFIKINPESAFSPKLTEQLTLYGVPLDAAS